MAAVRTSSILMHRHSASIARSPLVINDQPGKHRLDMIVRRIREVSVCKVRSVGKQGVSSLFAHVRIIGRFLMGGYTNFVVFVHVATVAA